MANRNSKLTTSHKLDFVLQRSRQGAFSKSARPGPSLGQECVQLEHDNVIFTWLLIGFPVSQMSQKTRQFKPGTCITVTFSKCIPANSKTNTCFDFRFSKIIIGRMQSKEFYCEGYLYNFFSSLTHIVYNWCRENCKVMFLSAFKLHSTTDHDWTTPRRLKQIHIRPNLPQIHIR